MIELVIMNSFTNAEDRSLNIYFNDIHAIHRLSIQQEVILTARIRLVNMAAMHQLVNGNLRFVISVAKRYQHQGLSLNDLVNEGNFGLIRAAKSFDETKGFKFISYDAVWWIRQSISFAIADQSRLVRLPYYYNSLLQNYNKVRAKLEQEHSRSPSTSELASSLEVEEYKLAEIVAVPGKVFLSTNH